MEDLLSAALLTARHVVGLPATRLTQSRPISTRARLAARLADPEMRSPAQLNAEAGLIDWMLAPPAPAAGCCAASCCPHARWSRRAPARAPSGSLRPRATPRG